MSQGTVFNEVNLDGILASNQFDSQMHILIDNCASACIHILFRNMKVMSACAGSEFQRRKLRHCS